jgi:cell division septation protein DedD
LAKDAPEQVCLDIGQILSCVGSPISNKCGSDALLHVYDIHGTWVRVFNSTCVLEPSKLDDPTVTTKPTKIDDSTVTTKPAETTTQKADTTTQETTKSTLPSSDSTRNSLYHAAFVLSAIWFLF